MGTPALASAVDRDALVRRAWTVLPLALLYGLALWTRLRIWHSFPYGDEGGFYYVAGHFWHAPPNLENLYNPGWFDFRPVFWVRPMHFLLLFPGGIFSFESYRFLNIAYTSLLPVLAFVILRGWGARRALAFLVGLAVAFAPVFVVWGVITIPDGPMTVVFALALVAAQRGWYHAAGALLTLAVWVKEVAIVGVAFLLATAVWSGRRDFQAWPLRLNKPQTAYLGALILGPLALMYAMTVRAPLPGGLSETEPKWLLDQLFMTSWLIPLLPVGLLWPRSRFPAALGLAYPVFYVVYTQLLGRGVNLWYLVLPNFLVLLGAAMTLNEAWNQAAPQRRTVVRWIPAALALFLTAILAVSILAPNSEGKADWVQPLSQTRLNNLRQSVDYEVSRDNDLQAAIQAMRLAPERDVFLADLYEPYVVYPVAVQSGRVWNSNSWDTEHFGAEVSRWSDAIESRAHVTLVDKNRWGRPTALIVAVQEVYADCAVHDSARYLVIEGASCAGRGDELEASFERHKQDPSLHR